MKARAVKLLGAAACGIALYFAAVFDGTFAVGYFLYFTGALLLLRTADDLADYRADALRGRAPFGRGALTVALSALGVALPFCFFGDWSAMALTAGVVVFSLVLFLVKKEFVQPLRAVAPPAFVAVLYLVTDAYLRITLCAVAVLLLSTAFFLLRRQKHSRFICDYETFDGDPSQIGGKAFNLYRLGAFGCPAFFVVKVDFFENALGTAYAAVDALLSRDAFGDDDAAELRAIVADAGLAEKLRARLKDFLKNKRYAVRSSCVGEDGGEHSYAGVMESYLNVDAGEVADRAVDVFLSAYSRRAAEYRRAAGLNGAVRTAVIVQEMADADFAGVVFTVDPLTDNPDAIYISAGEGLGEGIVGGGESGCDYVVDVSGKIAFPDRDLLGEGTVRKIAKMARRLQQNFDTFLDVEFAVVGHKVLFLQVRSVTQYKNIRLSERLRTLDNANIVESYSGVVADLTVSFAKEVYANVYRAALAAGGLSEKTVTALGVYYNNMLCVYDGRLYYDLGSWYGLVGCLPFASGKRAMEKMMGVRSSLRTASCALSVFGALRVGSRYLAKVRRLDRDVAACEDSFAAYIAPYEASELTGVGAPETVAIYNEVAAGTISAFVVPVVNDVAAMLSYHRLTKKVAAALKKYTRESGESCDAEGVVGEILGGKRRVISVRSLELMQKIVDGIESDAQKKYDFSALDDAELWRKYGEDALIGRYLREFGARVGGELKLETETFVQRPEKIIGAIKNFLGAAEKPSAEKNLSAAAAYCLRMKSVAAAAERAERHIVYREKLRLIRTRTFSAVRCVFLHLGRLLADSGAIAEAGDIFFLTKDEAFALAKDGQACGDVKQRVAVRKEAYRANGELPECDRIVRYKGGDLRVKNGKGKLTGIPSGQGSVTGVVKLITDPYGQKVNGEIILAKQTDPGWIPLFMNCRGVIVEKGSVLSHSAVISRELGLPCVVGLARATELIPDGSTVTINAASGEVRIVEEKIH